MGALTAPAITRVIDGGSRYGAGGCAEVKVKTEAKIKGKTKTKIVELAQRRASLVGAINRKCAG